MKNSIFTKYSWILALCATLFTSVLYVACTKDVNVANEQPQSVNNATKTPEVDHELAVKEQVEAIGRMSYNHMKLYFTQKKAADYVNPLIRAEVMETVAKSQAEYKGLTAAETIQKVTAEGKMSKAMSQKMTDLLTLTESIKNLSSIGEIEKAFKDFESQIYGNKELTDDEVFYINGLSAAIRNASNFEDEMLRGQRASADGRNRATSRDVGCDLIQLKSSCIGGALIKAGTATVGADFKLWISGGPTDKGPGYFTTGKVAFFAGLLEGLINAYFNNACKCDASTSSSDGCYHPQVINPIVDTGQPCSQYIAFAVGGYGPSPSQFIWNGFYTDANGVEHNIPNVQNKPTTIPVLRPFTVPDPNATIRLVVSVSNANCGPFVAEFSFKMSDLIGNPGDVIVSGPSQVSLNSTGVFVISGSCLANPLNTFSWNNPSAGTVVSGGTTTAATIQFTTRTCYSYNGYSQACFPVSVKGNTTSGCAQPNGSFKTNSGSMSVKVP
jgi:predicted transport protein